MNFTPTISELATALARFQGIVKQPLKNKEVKYGTTKFKYADLAQCIECAREPLSKNGLSVVQLIEDNAAVTTILMHQSGEFISSTFAIPISGRPQDYGSAITYLKRYAYCAILGIVADDDDNAQVAAALQEKQGTPAPVGINHAPQVAQHDLVTACAELHGAATMQDLQRAWSRWKLLQAYPEVVSAKETRKNELSHAN